ncbi:cellulose biosynthesis protein BcsQ [Rhodopseudomonas rhenobacensis]|uniref:Cellulose biosynthesis protein BcsQ n=1 Tax=Rhodopseudomonas rhenobacensis TaxID=87461 RepID=A0A7W8E1G6_9BRAD|nr:AAA family ATPase [Rhodopseudomonas rhenobacensis]MBB5049997.1 cellulose biosynthesis protein BcsQ [Rhodopseudomonas rhenobacensis]
MSAKIIAVANMKGGVGKTATVVSLAEALAASGYRVLVIDLDAQANASICLAGDSILAMLMARQATIEGFLHDRLLGGRQMSISDCIRHNVSNVSHLNQPLAISLLPSSPELRNFEQMLIYELTQAKMSWADIVKSLTAVMSTHLGKARRSYDFVLIDCAPGISALTEVSIRLADLVIVPTIADFLSTFGLQHFCATMSSRGLSEHVKRPSRPPYVLITRRRKVKLHAETAAMLRNEATADKPAFAMFATEIPETAAIGDALGQTTKFPIFSQKWGPVVVPLLADLVDELTEVLDVDRA